MSVQSQAVPLPQTSDGHLAVTSAVSHRPGADAAIAELRQQLGDTADLYAIFVSPGYDLDAAATAIGDWCDDRVIGCTSAGNIGLNGYEDGGIVALALTGGGIRTRTLLLEPIVGASAGDALTFTKTAVYHLGHFRSDAATLTMVVLEAPFEIFRLQHHEATDRVLIATDASPDQRLIHSFNGRPAVEVYAETVGVCGEKLSPEVFSANPLVLQAAGGSWVRSIKTANPDGSLGLFAAVDVGEVLRVGRPAGMIEKLEERFAPSPAAATRPTAPPDARVAELTRTVDEQRRTITALISAAERRTAAEPDSAAMAAWQRNATLQRRVAERTIRVRAAEQLLRSVIDSLDAGLCILVNDAFTRMNGFSAAECLGKTRVSLLDSAEPMPELSEFRSSDGQFVLPEVLTKTKDGRPYWLKAELFHVIDEDGVVRLVGVERDVTARREAEQTLLEAMERSEALAQELSMEKAVLTGVISSIPHLTYWQVLCSGEAVVDRQITIARSGGDTRTVLMSVLPQPDAAGHIGGLIGVGVDVTRISELERQLNQNNRLEAIGQLAAGIAHEINTPIQFVSDNTRFVSDSFTQILDLVQGLTRSVDLATIGDPAQVVAELTRLLADVDVEFLVDEIPTALTESLEGLERVAQIVRAMKDFSHPGQGRSAIDVNRAIESTVQVARNEWKYHAELDLGLGADVGLVPCYEGEFKQVVLNLIVNAAHAIEAGQARAEGGLGLIRITTRRLADCVEVAISDNGSGMDKATQQRIFDPFFTTKEVGKGTGQGLSMAYASIVQKHGGSIRVDSTPAIGTTFTLVIPTQADPELEAS